MFWLRSWNSTIAAIHENTSKKPTTTLRTSNRPRRVCATRGSAWIDSPALVRPSPSLPTLAPTSGTFFATSPTLVTPSPIVPMLVPSTSTPPVTTSCTAFVIRLLRPGPAGPVSIAVTTCGIAGSENATSTDPDAAGSDGFATGDSGCSSSSGAPDTAT